ncbi:hemerythrin-like metal-binding protein [Thermoclostridium stercorarium subsp. stercorarium DSM 8532]|jgi:hemerythrin|uniref:Hemerythrin-like metal-binding protein n=3 Tax=Thermoclostridium stercorarium TaxID=1510 RepID=L7VQ42_THES1|nr:bacteriohemerythrin [Thermoclostridium stercorarium]AGC68546.1 hemerythrin-like metal-binding protein [Thermoclostridium stercorarium subsp. stercorarium DSM 8532]AGI39562.1 metal-binding domain-containing protein [Thermoclostridium stercorarium subsp. stercorarium DSM 8532]ANW98896.1 hemerythrin [Thermoclostridium stercorarium subsp. thermolacticum DSM 2910]ANX01423.1 hemerythrin [Thermoclostridium stercorarium subsp. leptospartum DSM 9219]UZQ84532.1 bacteriohemerythrin [Thermoclostridium 
MFKWNENYRTGIEVVDEQHKKLIDIGAKLEDMLYAGDSLDYYDYIMETINELKDYADYHFTFEEKLMREHDYPELEEHRMEHLYFIKRIDRLAMEDIDSRQVSVISETLDFLARWLFSHILNSDMKYADFLKRKSG